MARCSCSGTTCGCVVQAGSGASVEGAGTVRDPYVISLDTEGGGGSGGFIAGDIKDTVRNDTPAGWLECNGQAVSRTTYPNLFTAIGTQWGAGDGFSTFNVPDFRARFRLGVGAGYALGASGGLEQTVLVAENVPAHTHTMTHTHNMAHTHDMSHGHGTTGSTNADHIHAVPIRYTVQNNTTTGGSGQRISELGSGPNIYQPNSLGQSQGHAHAVPNFTGSTGGSTATNTGGSSAANTGSTGNSTPFTNMPPYRAVRVLIKS